MVGGKAPGMARGYQNVAEQLEAARGPAGGDLGHVPDDRPTSVEIGCGHQQEAAPGVLDRDLLEHLLGNGLFDQVSQRRIIGQTVVEYAADNAAFFQDVIGRNGGVKVAQVLIVFRTEEGKRRQQRAGADAGHQVERRAIAGYRPAAQQAGPESPVVSAAGQGEEMGRRQGPGQSGCSPCRKSVFHRLPHVRIHRCCTFGQNVAHARHAGNFGPHGRIVRDGAQALGRRTRREHEHRRGNEQQSDVGKNAIFHVCSAWREINDGIAH
jgi:hypothetical protein